jgi:hypothetical protein
MEEQAVENSGAGDHEGERDGERADDRDGPSWLTGETLESVAHDHADGGSSPSVR